VRLRGTIGLGKGRGKAEGVFFSRMQLRWEVARL
jgi:hypothetical protein